MNTQNLAFVDIEAIGARVNYMIEIGILKIENNRLIKTYNTLINPQTFVSPSIEEMTGIRKEDLDNAPTFYEIKNDLLSILKDLILLV